METGRSIAKQWTSNVNKKDIQAVLNISDPHIELAGPRGAAEGHDMLRKWIEESGIYLQTQNVYAKDNQVILTQKATWENQSGHVTIYTFMEIRNGKIYRLGRFDTLDDAFGQCQLSEEDQVE